MNETPHTHSPNTVEREPVKIMGAEKEAGPGAPHHAAEEERAVFGAVENEKTN